MADSPANEGLLGEFRGEGEGFFGEEAPIIQGYGTAAPLDIMNVEYGSGNFSSLSTSSSDKGKKRAVDDDDVSQIGTLPPPKAPASSGRQAPLVLAQGPRYKVTARSTELPPLDGAAFKALTDDEVRKLTGPQVVAYRPFVNYRSKLENKPDRLMLARLMKNYRKYPFTDSGVYEYVEAESATAEKVLTAKKIEKLALPEARAEARNRLEQLKVNRKREKEPSEIAKLCTVDNKILYDYVYSICKNGGTLGPQFQKAYAGNPALTKQRKRTICGLHLNNALLEKSDDAKLVGKYKFEWTMKDATKIKVYGPKGVWKAADYFHLLDWFYNTWVKRGYEGDLNVKILNKGAA